MALKKIYKTVEQENGKLTIYGSNRWIPIQYNKSGKEFFVYRGMRYYLQEFMKVESFSAPWLQEFHGYNNDSFFSGVLIIYSDDGESVKAFTYIG